MSNTRKPAANAAYSADEIIARLPAELPKWHFADGQIVREFKTSGWKSTLLVANTIGHLAEAAWHHPDLELAYASISVRLKTHDAQGITEKDFALARKIEEVVMWQPGAVEESPLTGTPDDPRYLHLKYD